MESVHQLLEFFGLVMAILICCLTIVTIIDYIRKVYKGWKWRYEYEHRFDKPPLAKCYCNDCIYYKNKRTCSIHDGWHVADDWFCWDAQPWESDPKEEMDGED